MRLILDLNSMLNASQLRGTDHENGQRVDHDGEKIYVNSAEYGFDNFSSDFADTLAHFGVAPRKVIGVWDGFNAKGLRQAHLPGYKAGRSKAPAVSEQLQRARGMVTEALRKLGVQIVTNAGVEADDVIAYLCRNLRGERNTVVTVDGDLCVLIDSNTDVYRMRELNKNPYGMFPPKYITLYKALVGDTSDKIKGAVGFGDAAWVELVRKFGFEGLDELERMIAHGELQDLAVSVPNMPKLKLILDQIDGVTISWRVASLMPHEVNTMSRPLEWQAGMVQCWEDVPEALRMHRLKSYYGTKTLVTAENYEEALSRLKVAVRQGDFTALDIETSSSMESDLWMLQVRDRDPDAGKVDTLGHELTGMSLTFGSNHQHTIYACVDHREEPGYTNITSKQCRELVEAVPTTLHETVIHNRAFEFPVLYKAWGDDWRDNGWGGFVPNAVDTMIGASYVNENLPRGLKFRSNHHLGYTQATYEDTVTMEGPIGTLPTGGNQKAEFEKAVGDSDDVEMWERRQYKMRELTGRHVKNYGCDDTVCTSALHSHFLTIMEMEGSLRAFREVETLPQYLTSLAFVQGVPASMSKLRALETADDKKFDEAWGTLRAFLISRGWDGTVLPVAESVELGAVKQAVQFVTGNEFTSRKRKPEAVSAEMLAAYPDNDDVRLLAGALVEGNVGVLNAVVKRNFNGEPKINFDSPVQMRNLMYRVIGITPRIYNKLTEREREDEEFAASFSKLRKYQKDPSSVNVTEQDRANWIKKASTDDDAVEFALFKDELDAECRAALEAFSALKRVMTLRKMFYKPYKACPHWTDGLVHSNMNQCEAATRRYSSTDPNLQQLPTKGGFREVLKAHHDDAIVVSLDFKAQELVLCAFASGDEALRSCYVGDNRRDGHSLIAVAASEALWGKAVTYEEFVAMRKSTDKAVKGKADDLRDDGKTVNFATQFGAMAPKVAMTLRSTEEVAQELIDAKDRAFPGINIWKDEVTARVKRTGFTTTMLGARRHLSASALSNNQWDNMRGERQGVNMEIQGSAAEQTKLAMASMWKRGLFTGKYDARFIAPVHDETLSSVHRNQAVAFIREAHACMVQQYANLDIPMESTLCIGRDLSTPIEIGTQFTDEQVQAAIDQLFATKKTEETAELVTA